MLLVLSLIESSSLPVCTQVAEAGQLANFLVVKSTLYPGFRNSAMAYNMRIGDQDDPTTSRLKPTFEPHILALQEVKNLALDLVSVVRAPPDLPAALAAESDVAFLSRFHQYHHISRIKCAAGIFAITHILIFKISTHGIPTNRLAMRAHCG